MIQFKIVFPSKYVRVLIVCCEAAISLRSVSRLFSNSRSERLMIHLINTAPSLSNTKDF